MSKVPQPQKFPFIQVPIIKKSKHYLLVHFHIMQAQKYNLAYMTIGNLPILQLGFTTPCVEEKVHADLLLLFYLPFELGNNEIEFKDSFLRQDCLM